MTFYAYFIYWRQYLLGEKRTNEETDSGTLYHLLSGNFICDETSHYPQVEKYGSSVRIDMRQRDSALDVGDHDDAEDTGPRYPPRDVTKTVVAAVFLLCNFILATVSLALTHERLPDRQIYKPLPDIVLDRVIAQDWALDVSEILIMVSTVVTVLIMFFHHYRWIVFRRAFMILGLLYLMRSITMYVTVLPVSSYTYFCSPKANSTSFLVVAKRVVHLVSGFGLSINGQQTYCGDYIYSGHTVILVSAYLFIQEYTDKKYYYLLHWASLLVSITGIVMVLIARGHYTIDVLIAYYVSTRVFWIYHTLALNAQLKTASSTNFLSRIWWFSLFCYLESNVDGPVPNKFSFPWIPSRPRSRRN